MEYPWINLTNYTTYEFALYWGGFFLWAVAYVLMMFRIPKEKFVDMPVLVASGNIAWEFLWATVFSSMLYKDMGALLVWLYRAGFLFDCWIFFNVYRYGWKQWSIKPLLDNYKWVLTFITACWLAIFWFYTSEGNDNPLGTFSAMQLNLVISPLCVVLILKMNTTKGFMISVGWLKMIGTLMVTLFLISKFPDHHYIHTVGIIIAICDNTYIYLWYKIRARERAAAQIAPQAA